MQHDLEEAYVPSCEDCQQNKSWTHKPAGPLHPLPIPDAHFDSIAINFIEPLPPDKGFDTIITMTNHLRANRNCPTIDLSPPPGLSPKRQSMHG